MNVTFSKGQFSKSKWVRVFQSQHFSGDTSPKTNMTMENQPRMKMYFLLKTVFFQPVMLIFGCMLVFWAHLLTEMGFKPPILEHFGAGVVGRIPIPGCGWWGGLCLFQRVVAMLTTDQIPQITNPDQIEGCFGVRQWVETCEQKSQIPKVWPKRFWCWFGVWSVTHLPSKATSCLFGKVKLPSFYRGFHGWVTLRILWGLEMREMLSCC